MKIFERKKIDLFSPEKKLYRLAVATVIGLIFFNQLLIQYILDQQRYDAKTISMASRQRLLCHQIVDLMINEPEAVTDNHELRGLTEEWNMVHQALQNGNKALGIDKLDGEEVVNLFKEANPYQFKIYDRATGKSKLGDVVELEASAQQFSSAMEQVVNKCEAHSQSKLSATMIVEIVLALVTLMVLLFEIKYIFRPAFSRINKQQLLLKRENKNLRKTQDLLQAIQDSSSLAIIVVDRDFKIISLNKKAVRNIRFVQNQTIKEGTPIIQYIPAHLRTNFLKSLQLVLSGKSTKEEYCLVNTKNKTRWYEIEFHPMKEDGKHLSGVAFSVKDITRSKEYEIDLEQQNDRLKKIAFVHAHELRGPVTSMLGLIDVMTQEKKANNSNNGHLEEGYLSHFKNLSGKVDKIIRDIVSVSEADYRKVKKTGNGNSRGDN
ncbi:MAG: PAS domain-containing protein [Reichenbachiella sp.]|uniref:PAS domain-containing protein n=1 Tax=Reichenbachiella sp. TaxID=2184521 RepID=UPI0032647C97